MSKNFKITNFLGPFVFIVLLMLSLVLIIFGFYQAATTLPVWVWLITLSAVVAGWLTDRLMFFGINKMNQKGKHAFSEQLLKQMESIRKNVAEIEKRKPTIPRTDEPLN